MFLTLYQTFVYDHAWGTETRFINRHILYAWMFPDTTEDSRRVPYPYESLISHSYTERDSTRLIPIQLASYHLLVTYLCTQVLTLYL